MCLFYTLDLSIFVHSWNMPSRKKTTQEKPLVKRLLDGLIPKRTTKWKSMVAKITEDDSESSVDNELVTRSSSEIKRHEDVPSSKGNGNKQDASTVRSAFL